MSVPTNENSLALAAVDIGGSTHRNWARSESEWSHSAHSRSRDQPRDRGGSLGETEVGCGSWHVRTLTAETPGKHNYYY